MTRKPSDLDLKKLEIFYKVAELKSFSEAAERVSLRQPTISSHIRDLENQVGGKLFDRVGGEVCLTRLGELLFAKAGTFRLLKNEIRSAIDGHRGVLQGELFVGGSTIPGEYILPAQLANFKKRYPQVRIQLKVADSGEIVDAVLKGEVELGVVGFKNDDRHLSFQKLGRDELIVTVSPDHPWCRLGRVSVQQLKNGHFISREAGSGTLKSLNAILKRIGYNPEELLQPFMELGSTQAVKVALMEGLGYSILSKTAVEREIAARLLNKVDLKGRRLHRDFFLVLHRQRTSSPACKAFRTFLTKSY
jgi:DNA-binding transcriptional LysR family regulator